ncbi:MAG: class I SAM-dependent methyltransferase [Pseudomonadota bacterium]
MSHSSKDPVSVGVLDDGSALIQELAQSLNVPLVTRSRGPGQPSMDFLLCRRSDDGAVCLMEASSGIHVAATFDSGALGYRRRQAVGGELLVKAAGGLRAAGQTVIDATAGLGRDALLLATAGFHVTMLERSPVVRALLDDGLHRARRSEDATLVAAVSRMSLQQCEALDWLREHQADVVCLDPMFPARRKSAQVKKEMYLLGRMLGQQEDGDDLLEPALYSAMRRVVVKRPKLAGNLGGRKPDWQLRGRSGRFDVYAVSP